MKDDRHKDAIPEEAVKEMQDALDKIIGRLNPYATPLTPQERHNLLKMGDKSLAFVEKAHEIAQHNSEFLPGFVKMSEFDTDFSDAHNLWVLLTSARQFVEILEDTVMAAGSEAFHQALAVYNNVRLGAKQDVPGAKAAFEELRTRFPHGKRRSGGGEPGAE